MLTTPEANITFTEIQKAQIEAAKSRLLNYESEVSIATNNLAVLKRDIVKATNERKYQEDLLATLTKQVEDKQTEKKYLDEVTEKQKADFNKQQQEMAQNVDDATTRSAMLDKREQMVEEAEKHISEEQKELQGNTLKLAEERTKVTKAHDVFSTAMETIVGLLS